MSKVLFGDMMKDIVIFGAGSIAKLAAHYFRTENQFNVAAFCVDDEFYTPSAIFGVPVVPFSQLPEKLPPESYELFVGLGYQELNRARQRICGKIADLSYSLASCISSRAVILNDDAYGKNCFIMEGAVLQPFSRIGNNCICWTNSIVAHESVVGDNCFLSAGSVIGGMSVIGDNCFLGINATIRNDVTIGNNCVIGAGSVILNDLRDNTLVASRSTPPAKMPASVALRFIDL